MTDKKYIVLSKDGDIVNRGLTMVDAALTILRYDGHDYQIRKSDDEYGWYRLYVRDNLYYGNKYEPTMIFSLKKDRETAEQEIFQKVVDTDDFGIEAITEESYNRMLEECAD